MPWNEKDEWENPEFRHESRLSEIPTVAGGIISAGGVSAKQRAENTGHISMDVNIEYFLYRLINDEAIDSDMSTSDMIRKVLMEKFCPEYLE